MVVRKNHGTPARGIRNISNLVSTSGVAETTTTLVTVDDGAVLDEWRNQGVLTHQIKGDGRHWFKVLLAPPASPVDGDVWFEDTGVTGIMLMVQTSSGTLQIPAGDGSLEVTAATALLQGHAVRATATGLQYAAAVQASEQYRIVGIVAEDTLIATDATVLTNGDHIELSDWTLLTGALNLVPGATYWLSATPGRYTTTPVIAARARVGIAVTTTKLLIDTNLTVLS